jgi:hypothetical protein
MKQIALAAVLTALWVAQPALAENDSKQFAVEGSGRLTCTDFVAARSDRNSAEYQRFIGFVEGYLSAANRYESNTFDLTPWHNAAAFDLILDAHCRAHGEDTIVSVVQRMVTGFRPVRVAQFSELLEVGDGQYHAYVYETVLRRAQAALRIHGHYTGAEDGRYSASLRDAFLEFQRKSDLEPTGVPDPATLWTLLNP